MKTRVLIFLMIFSFISAFSGCAGSRLYLHNVKYIPEKKTPPSTSPQNHKIVGICPFEDARNEKNKDIIGIRHRRGKYIDLFKVHNVSLSESVTQAIKDYFAEKGFKVTDCKGWDKSPEGLNSLPEDLSLVVGGNVESFMVEARSGLMSTETHYRVKIIAFIGRIEKAKVITRTIESMPKTKKIEFNPKEVKATLDNTLTEVIQKLFK